MKPCGDTVTPELLARIPTSSRLVLHVGCGTGTLGEDYKRINPVAKIVGVDADADAVAEARTRLDLVYVSDIVSDPVPFYGEIVEGSVDCIVYRDDIAAHEGFWEVLKQHVGYLSDAGCVLLAISNDEHWSVAESRLKGVSLITDDVSPPIKRTHRLTQSEIRDTFASVGLGVVEAIPLETTSLELDAFVERIAPGLQNLGIDLAAFRRRSAAPGHIWRAGRRQPATRLAVVSTMLTPVGGVSEVRVIEPMQALKAEPSLKTVVVSNGEAPALPVEEPKIFIFHRPLLAGVQGLARVRALLQAGWLVVCEFDDHPGYIPVLQRPDIQNFRAVHAIQTTTEALATVLSQYNPEVASFDNAIAALPNVENFADSDHVTLFFAGLNRDNDWPPLMDAINAVSARVGARLKFEVVGDRGFFDALRSEHKNFTPLCDYAVYRNILSRCEISFMPLSETPFNLCKSDLKYIEAAAHRVAALASPVVYSTVIDDGRTGVLFRNAQELAVRLTDLVNAPDLACSIANAGRQYVKDKRMLTYQLPRRTEWYHSLWERRDSLNISLRDRVPEL